MFDLGLSELIVIGVVALVVIGPERLPKVARSAGIVLGRMQRYVAGVKADINRELQELEQLKELKNLKKEVEQAGGEIESTVRQNILDAENQIKQINDEVGANLAEAAGPFDSLQSPQTPASTTLGTNIPAETRAMESGSEAAQLELGLEQATPSSGSEPTPSRNA